jgi:hypothetical protein
MHTIRPVCVCASFGRLNGSVRARLRAFYSLVVVVSVWTSATASGADGPALGTWALVNSAGGQEFRSTLVIAQQQGPYVEGYVDFQLPRGPVCLQVVAGTFDPATRRLGLDGREILTRYDEATLGPGTQRFECIVSSDGKELRDFVSLGNPGSGTARWVRGGRPAERLPELATALDEKEERWRLYQQLSADYTIGGLRVLHGPDRYRLAQLARSADEHVRELAKVRLALQGLQDDVEGKARRLSGELKEGMPAEVFDFVFRTVNDGVSGNFSLDPLVGLLNSDLLKKRFQQDARKLSLYIEQAMVINGMRSRLKEEYRKRGAPALDQTKSISATFKLSTTSCGAIAVKNTSGMTLHHCMINSHMVVDKQRMDEYERDYWQKNAGTIGLMGLAGVNMIPAVEADRALLAYNRIDKGVPVYVPEWKPGLTVELDVARPDAIMIVGASIDVWVGCDEGTVQRELDMQLVRTVARRATSKAPADQPPQQPRRRRRS